MNQSDLRYIKTEDLIKQAFLSCASEYDIQDVHIKDICAKARISRNAFYSHYENKYQVLEQICRETEERMLNELNPEIIKMLSNNTMYSTSEWCINMIYDNQDLFRILARCSESSLRRMIHSIFIKSTLSSLYDNTEQIKNDLILQMSESFITDALTAIILLWLKNPGRITKEQLTDYLYEIAKGPIEVFYRKLDESRSVKRKKIDKENRV
ncbi:MAG: TetR/AcrR family transcriptional regulator [Solobacterium sp.]|nr:TetR/AcrR family transcriptional regulator [Solobacterium sp.]